MQYARNKLYRTKANYIILFGNVINLENIQQFICTVYIKLHIAVNGMKFNYKEKLFG